MTDPARSCATCPSFLRAEQTPSKFKKNIGAPVCGRYGHVLGKAGIKSAQEVKIQEHFAGGCPSYGAPAPLGLPDEYNFGVLMPDPDARVDTTGTAESAAVNSCAGCRNFIRDSAVANEMGWLAGACAAKGKLILSNRQVAEARGCEFRAAGPNWSTVPEVMHLRPEYEQAFQEPGDLTDAYFRAKDNFVEPHDYPTDQAVAPEDTRDGIRAWRRIEDPEGTGKFVMLPVFDPDFFSPEERAKIPRTGQDEHPELYIDHFGGAYMVAVAWLELDETPCLWGMAGIGKTELYRHLAWLMCLPFERFSITAASEIDDLAGKMRYSPEEGTYFQYGRISLAWQKPCVLCIDEPNTGPLEVWQFTRPMFDNSKQLVLDMNEADMLERNDFCYPGLAMNPAWDPKNVGALEISDADARRLFHSDVPLPPERLEKEIIKNRIKLDGWEISDKELNFLIKVANDLRAMTDDLSITWGIANQIKVARAMHWFSPETAYKRAIGDFLDPKQREMLLDTVRSHLED